MKRFNGTVVQQLVNVKSIVIMVLIMATFLGVACSEKSHATSTDVGGKGREIVKANETLVNATKDVGGPKGQEIRFSISNEQPAILILEVGGKSSNESQMITTLHDVGGGKTVSTTKNALADVGGRGTILTGNVVVVFQNGEDVGGKSTGVMRIYAKTPYTEVGGKEIKNMRNAIPKTDFT